MTTATAHVITAATWEYLTPEGKRRRAFFGDTVELTDEQAERGFKVGALGVQLPAESTGDDSDPAEADAIDDGDGAQDADTGSDTGGDGDPNSTAGDSGDAGEGISTEGEAPRKKPLKAATKPVLVDWLMSNGTYDRGELEEQDKDDLWALIEATD